MSASLLAALKNGEFQKGIALFEALSQPTSEEYHWAGVCHLYLGNLMESQRLLKMAVARGEDKARLDLVCCLRNLGHFEEAQDVIQKMKRTELSAADAAYVLREQAILAIQQSEVTYAAQLLDEAWQLAMHAEEDVQAVIAHSIALNASNQGDERKAAAYLEIAEPHSVGNRKVYVLLAQCASYIALGKLDRAEETINKAALLIKESKSVLSLRYMYYKGFLQLAQGKLDEARATLLQHTETAREIQYPEEELYAELSLSEIAMRLSDVVAERRHIQRLKVLSTTRQQQILIYWREGSFLSRQGDLRGLELLRQARDFFRAKGYQREELGVQLYLAESHAAQPDEQAQALRAAADLHLLLGQQHDLGRELEALPGVRALLGTAEFAYEQILLPPRWLQPPSPAAPSAEALPSGGGDQAATPLVQLRTLGHSELLLDTQPVGFRLKKTLEVVAFLLRYGPSTLSHMQEEMFADVPPARSKNYIHQVRLDLKRVPGLSIPYNARFQTYSVQLDDGLEVQWDALQLEQALKAQSHDALLDLPLAVADFLPESESAWAEREREQWQALLDRVSLQALESWARAGEYPKVQHLAQRLLDINPLEVAVQVWLLRALAVTAGPEAARLRAWESEQLFKRELGQVPAELLGWETGP